MFLLYSGHLVTRFDTVPLLGSEVLLYTVIHQDGNNIMAVRTFELHLQECVPVSFYIKRPLATDGAFYG